MKIGSITAWFALGSAFTATVLAAIVLALDAFSNVQTLFCCGMPDLCLQHLHGHKVQTASELLVMSVWPRSASCLGIGLN
jgi:hypothetical protein